MSAIEEARLTRRIVAFYGDFNRKKWEACYRRLDPKLRTECLDDSVYMTSLASFYDRYGPIVIDSLVLSVYLDVANNRHDDRPFAYGVLHWRDRKCKPHLLKERWVNSSGTWYTRMAGLV